MVDFQQVLDPMALVSVTSLPQQDVLLVTSSRATIRVVGLPTMLPLKEFALNFEPQALQASPTFGQLAMSRNHHWDIVLISWLSGDILATFKAHSAPIQHLEWYIDKDKHMFALTASWDRLAKVGWNAPPSELCIQGVSCARWLSWMRTVSSYRKLLLKVTAIG